MTAYTRKRPILIGLLLGVWIITSACTCSGVEGQKVSTPKEETQTPATIAPALSPTPLPTHSPPRSAPSPTPAIVRNLGSVSSLLAQPDTSFTIEMTEAQLNEYLEGKTFEKEGAKIEDVQVSLRENGMICSLRATQIDSGLSAGLTVQGTLSVDNGTAYFQVGDFTLDSSIQGFARLIANATIESIIKQYSTPQGIPLPISQVEFYDLQVTQGNIVIVGHTR